MSIFPKNINNPFISICLIFSILLISSSSFINCLIEIPIKIIKTNNPTYKYKNITLKLPNKEDFINYSDYLKIFSESGEYIISNEYIFLAPIKIGSNNQSFNLLLDTGSIYLWVSKTNSEGSTTIKRHYDPSSSSTSINTKEILDISYLSGSCSGYFYKDIVSYINNIPFQMKFGVASITSFDVDNADGILGLSRYYQNNEESLIMSMYKKSITNSKSFSFKFSGFKNGTFYIGKHEDFSKEENAYCSLLSSTEYEKNLWSCKMNSMSLSDNNTSIDVSGKYSVFFDTGTNMIIMPLEYLNEIKNDINKFNCSIYKHDDGYSLLLCGNKQPEFKFNIDGNIFKIPNNYTYYKAGEYYFSCVIFMDTELYIFGSPFFLAFHTLFNYDDKKLYFYSEDPNNLIKGSGISGGGIALIIISILIVVGLLVFLIIFLIRRKLKRKNHEIDDISNENLIANSSNN